MLPTIKLIAEVVLFQMSDLSLNAANLASDALVCLGRMSTCQFLLQV